MSEEKILTVEELLDNTRFIGFDEVDGEPVYLFLRRDVNDLGQDVYTVFYLTKDLLLRQELSTKYPSGTVIVDLLSTDPDRVDFNLMYVASILNDLNLPLSKYEEVVRNYHQYGHDLDISVYSPLLNGNGITTLTRLQALVLKGVVPYLDRAQAEKLAYYLGHVQLNYFISLLDRKEDIDEDVDDDDDSDVVESEPSDPIDEGKCPECGADIIINHAFVDGDMIGVEFYCRSPSNECQWNPIYWMKATTFIKNRE